MQATYKKYFSLNILEPYFLILAPPTAPLSIWGAMWTPVFLAWLHPDHMAFLNILRDFPLSMDEILIKKEKTAHDQNYNYVLSLTWSLK